MKSFVVLLVAVFLFGPLAVPFQKTDPGDWNSAYQMLTSRPNWSSLSPKFLTLLAQRLQSSDKTRQFIAICEQTRIFKERVLPLERLHREDPELVVLTLASVLTSHGGVQISRNQYGEAKNTLKLALQFDPAFWPAWGRLALVALAEGNCKEAVAWADKVLADKRAYPTVQEEIEVGKALEDPNMVGSSKKVRDGMRFVKSTCEGR